MVAAAGVVAVVGVREASVSVLCGCLCITQHSHLPGYFL